MVVLPVVLLILVVIVYVVIKLMMGYSIPETMVQLAGLWQTAGPLLIGITNVMGVVIILTTIWKNRKKLQDFIAKEQD